MILSTVLLLVPALLVQAGSTTTMFKLSYRSDFNNSFTGQFQVSIPKGSILFGAMRKIHQLNQDKFSFQYTVEDYGLYLQSVNGLQANTSSHTYWELLKAPNKPLTVGIGCYVVQSNDHIILRFTSY
ncbi:TCO1 protein, partial [Atractosteus spatula]|nr:TCO1 protein [Atractosteus spatula]